MSGPSSRKLFAPELAQRLDVILSASSSRRSLARLAAGLEALARPQQDLVLAQAAVAALTSAELGYLVASLAPAALGRLDAEGFAAWVLAGLDHYDREGLRSATAALRGVEGFSTERQGSCQVRLADIEARLTRFVQGLAGRPLALRVGNTAWTDTETLYLPETLAWMPTAEGNRRLYKMIAALLWAQTCFGTFNVDAEAALDSLPDRGRALDWLAVLEAVRLEGRIAEELPGLAGEMAELRGPWPAELAAAAARLSQPGAGVTDSLELLPGLMADHGEAPPLAFAGRLDFGAARSVRAQRIARATQVLRQTLAGHGKPGGAAPRPSTVKVFAPPKTDGSSPPTLDGVLLALPPRALEAAQSLLQDLGQIPPEALVPAGPGEWLPTHHVGDGPEHAGEETADARYDEWDFHRNTYRKGWCHVFEREVAPGDPAYVAEVKARYRPLIQQVRRRFEALRGEDRMLGRQSEGEEIDLDAQIDARIDRRNGVEPSPRIFRRRVRNERSMAAVFLVDMSGSTQGWVNDAEREALILLCEALEALGDDYAIYGFSGWTRTRCEIYRIKAFSDRYDEAVRRRIASIDARDYTRMGVAIRHATRELAKQAVRHRLLVTLSDGRPDDFGDEYRGPYGIEDTRRALLEARQQGIRNYCVTVDRHGADYLKHMYGPASYTVLSDVRQLPVKLADIYRRLTA